MTSLGGLLNAAGGLSYHLRAARYASGLWQPTRDALRRWLESWLPPERHVVLVGPSAGHTLPLDWLTRFDHLTILEPDPLARWLLQRRLREQLGRAQLTFISEDHLIEVPGRFPELLQQHPDAALMFSNVLGQLRHLIGDEADERLVAIKRAVRTAIWGRSWVSYHDRVSGQLRPTLPEGGLHTDHRLRDDELGSLYALNVRSTTLYDHATDGFFDDELPRVYFPWELTPGYFHLLEGVSSVRRG